MPQGGRGEKPISGRDDDTVFLGSGSHLAPNPSGLDIERKNPVGELSFESDEPRRESLLLLAGRKKSNAFGNLADGKHAQVEVRVGNLCDSGFHRGISVRFPKLGNGAGVE